MAIARAIGFEHYDTAEFQETVGAPFHWMWHPMSALALYGLFAEASRVRRAASPSSATSAPSEVAEAPQPADGELVAWGSPNPRSRQRGGGCPIPITRRRLPPITRHFTRTFTATERARSPPTKAVISGTVRFSWSARSTSISAGER